MFKQREGRVSYSVKSVPAKSAEQGHKLTSQGHPQRCPNFLKVLEVNPALKATNKAAGECKK